jgi:hypothetical protein
MGFTHADKRDYDQLNHTHALLRVSKSTRDRMRMPPGQQLSAHQIYVHAY